MTTTAIGIILLSTLFSLLNIEREIEPVKINKVIEKTDEIIIHPEIKIKEEVIEKTEIIKEVPNVEIVEENFEEILDVVVEEIEEEAETLSYQATQDFSKFYTENNTKERINNIEYIVRNDNYIPNTIEPFDEERPYIPALFGEIANKYSIYYENSFEDGEQKVIELESLLGYKIIEYDIDSYNTYIDITIELPEKTPEEVENVKEALKQMYLNKDIRDFFMNSAFLPEYKSEKYIDIYQQAQEL